MKSFDMESWLERIAKTEPDEISCSECLDLISQYVEVELARQPLDGKLERVAPHLEQCRVCREEYEVLRDLVDLENHGEAPSVDDLKKSF